jgi:hypothetical protein
MDILFKTKDPRHQGGVLVHHAAVEFLALGADRLDEADPPVFLPRQMDEGKADGSFSGILPGGSDEYFFAHGLRRPSSNVLQAGTAQCSDLIESIYLQMERLSHKFGCRQVCHFHEQSDVLHFIITDSRGYNRVFGDFLVFSFHVFFSRLI